MKLKQVPVAERRYIVCHKEEQAHKDRADRDAILDELRRQLKQGSKSLVGNKGYRKYLSTPAGSAFEIDEAKVKQDVRFDGKWVWQTDTDLPCEEVAMRYKDLLMAENPLRTIKSIPETRPIDPKCDDSIRGHVFCSFSALVLQRELQSRGWTAERQRIRDDPDELQELTLPLGEKTFAIRTPPVGDAGRAIQALGVALGPSVRLV